MLDMLSGALASAKTASEMGKGLLELRDAEKVRAAVFELRNQLMDLQERMLDAKEEQMRLLSRVAELENELTAKNEIASRRDRYERHQFEQTGHYAYALRKEFREDDKIHYLCSVCYEKGDLITLHGTTGLSCPACKYCIRATPAPKLNPRRRYY